MNSPSQNKAEGFEVIS